MNIATALNKKYIPYTVVMLTSLCINTPEHIDAFLLNSELDKADILSMENALSDYDICLHPLNIDKNNFSDRLPKNDKWSLETYYRLLLLDILPIDVKRILYLDVDLIITGSLSALYNMDFNGLMILAAIDACVELAPKDYGPKHQEMFSEAYQHGYTYFNAGVMLLNIDQMRRTYSFKTYLDAINAWNYEMV